MRLLLIPISAGQWKTPELGLAMEQAHDAARRISKKINLKRERTRFTLACEQIERLALSQDTVTTVEVGVSEVTAALEALPSVEQIRLPFISRKEIDQSTNTTLQTFSEGMNADGGLVVIHSPFKSAAQLLTELKNERGTMAISVITPDYSVCETNIDELKPMSVEWSAHKQIRNAIEKGKPIGWINWDKEDEEEASGGRLARHEVLVDALRDYVGSQVVDDRGSNSQITICVAYPDGTIGEPIPLLCLDNIRQPEGLSVINVALISARHFEMDEQVEVSLIRNAEIERGDDSPIADQERFAFKKAMEFIEMAVNQHGGAEIHLFHTGLEPVIVGTYRAIVKSLQMKEIRGKLAIVPRVFNGKTYEELRPWY